MSLDFCVRQLDELIKTDYRVPRYAELKLGDDPKFAPNHLSIKDIVTPLLRDYSITKKREAYLIECLKYMVGFGCLFTYQDNIKKQKFMDELSEAIPDVNWPVYFKKPKPTTKDGG